MMELEIRHLRTLCAIADAGSLTKAAANLGVSQPSLTAQLKRIEKTQGGRLFERGRHGSAPTEFGEFVLARAREVLLGMDQLQRAMPPADQAHRQIRLGGISGPVIVGLADRIGDLLQHSRVTVQCEYSPKLLLDLLGLGRLDAAAVVDYPEYELRPEPAIAFEIIAVEPIFVALWADHPAAAREEIELADLADEPWVLSAPDGAGWPQYFRDVCHRLGFEPRVAHQVTELRPLRELIAGRYAISPCQATFSPGDGAVVRPLAGPPMTMRHVIAWRTSGPLAQHAADLVALAREAYTAYVKRCPEHLTWLRRHGPAR